jgi:hypothetical protein
VIIEESPHPSLIRVSPDQVRKFLLAILAAVADEDIIFARPMWSSHSDRCAMARLQRHIMNQGRHVTFEGVGGHRSLYVGRHGENQKAKLPQYSRSAKAATIIETFETCFSIDNMHM